MLEYSKDAQLRKYFQPLLTASAEISPALRGAEPTVFYHAVKKQQPTIF